MENGAHDVANVINRLTGEQYFFAPAHPDADDNGCLWSRPEESELDELDPAAEESKNAA